MTDEPERIPRHFDTALAVSLVPALPDGIAPKTINLAAALGALIVKYTVLARCRSPAAENTSYVVLRLQ